MSFLVSPGIEINEIDSTNVIPATSTSIGAYAGQFRWGPAGETVLVSSEKELAKTFGSPDTTTANSFLTASSFLKYGNALNVSRSINASAFNAGNASATASKIDNKDAFDLVTFSGANDRAYARYPGVMGNSLTVAFAHADEAFGTSSWADLFDALPGTSTHATNNGIENDEVNVIVIDTGGEFTGTANTVLEIFPALSILSDCKKDDGSTNYLLDVVNRDSEYIYLAASGLADSFGVEGGASDAVTSLGQTAAQVLAAGTDDSDSGTLISIELDSDATFDFPLSGGADSTVTVGNTVTALGLFEDPETIEVNLIFGEGQTASASQVTLSDEIIRITTARKDAFGLVSPPLEVTTAAAVKTFADLISSTSYVAIDSSPVYVYNKYADSYLYIAASGHMAGLCARTDSTNDPWFSPAGYDKGQLLGVTKLKINLNQANRDLLYKARVNPIVAFPGQGIVLFGDKTAQVKPSAFDRINVRRLFTTLEKAISTAAKYQLFKLNDEFTRASFRNMTEPYLRNVKGRRGVTDFLVVCDDTNNTAQVIDTNQFVGDIYVKPTRSINFITLNFIATRTGVEFSEIVGTNNA